MVLLKDAVVVPANRKGAPFDDAVATAPVSLRGATDLMCTDTSVRASLAGAAVTWQEVVSNK